MMTPAEVAEALHVSPRTVRKWLVAGKLRGVRVGGRLRVAREEVERFAATPAAMDPVAAAPAGHTEAA